MYVNCNGAGEMPGHEGEGSCDEDYNSFIDYNEDDILMSYIDSLEFEDIPEKYIDDNKFITDTDSAKESVLESYIDSLEFDDVPETFIENEYERSKE